MKSLEEYLFEAMLIPGIKEVDTPHIKTIEAYFSQTNWIVECFWGLKPTPRATSAKANVSWDATSAAMSVAAPPSNSHPWPPLPG